MVGYQEVRDRLLAESHVLVARREQLKLMTWKLGLYPPEVNCSSCLRSLPHEISRRLHVQRSDLRRQITRLSLLLNSAVLSGNGKSLGDTKRMAVGIMLTKLARDLAEHFASEERDGYPADSITAAPRLDHRAASLEWQHDEFRLRSHELIRLGWLIENSSNRWQILRTRFNDFGRDLLAHEKEETRLIGEAFLAHIGASR